MDGASKSMSLQTSINSRALALSDPSAALHHVGENSRSMVSSQDMQNGAHNQQAESIANRSKKLQDELHEVGQRIKHHEENVKYLKTAKNKLEESILHMTAALEKYDKEILPNTVDKDPAHVKSEEETIEHVLKHEKSAAALLFMMKSQAKALSSEHSLTKDVIGIVATLAKVDDDNLSRLFIADDPQKRLALLKPRLLNGETPPGFLGFAVNMITIDSTNLYCISKNGQGLRETLFYNLFSNLQVYKSREDMLKALPCIKDGAISLDGGMIRNPGFPKGSESLNLPESYFEIKNEMKEIQWKKDRAVEDIRREQILLDHARLNYETKKREFLQFLTESSSHASQYPVGTWIDSKMISSRQKSSRKLKKLTDMFLHLNCRSVGLVKTSIGGTNSID
ncbi:hypothetical protein DH2020_048545 [Rehmannia glutinosa]|uniref:Protein DEFECTIVE IN MERISTEM SILENCING 3 n=1 Tax=Rehmannia glutinosa TaxID=99300 RepID=A0ABR0U5H4_REHGL